MEYTLNQKFYFMAQSKLYQNQLISSIIHHFKLILFLPTSEICLQTVVFIFSCNPNANIRLFIQNLMQKLFIRDLIKVDDGIIKGSILNS